MKKASSVDAPIQVYNYATKRFGSRATYFAGKGSPGQLAIDYGSPKWKRLLQRRESSDEKFINRRWRFGANFWTNLDTNIPLTDERAPRSPPATTTSRSPTRANKKFVLNVLDPVSPCGSTASIPMPRT